MAEPPRVERIHPEGVETIAIQGQGWGSALILVPEVLRPILGDMPRVPHAILRPLADAVAAGAPAAAPMFRGRRGNPVLLSGGLFPGLLALRGDEGARRILQSLGERLVLVEAPDDGVLFDVDRPADLDKPGKR